MELYKVPVVSIMCAFWKTGIILLFEIRILFLPSACFTLDKVDIPLFLVHHLLSLPSFCLPFQHYVIFLLHNFIYSSVFSTLLWSHEHHQYLCYPSYFRVLGFGFFSGRFKKKIIFYYYFCFNLFAWHGNSSESLYWNKWYPWKNMVGWKGSLYV